MEATASEILLGIGASVRWERSSTQTQTEYGKLTGSTGREDRSSGPKNTAKWTMHENERSLRGIPNSLRVALLLKRAKEMSTQPFLAWVRVNADVSGLSLGTAQSSLHGEIDPIRFDPTFSRNDNIEWIQSDKLNSVDLARLVDVTLNSPRFVPSQDISQDEERERTTRREAEAFLANAEQNSDDRRGEEGSYKSWYVELWNMKLADAQWAPRASSQPGMESYRFEGATSKELSSELDEPLLREYFSWLSERPTMISTQGQGQGHEGQQEANTFCTLIVRKPAQDGLKTPEKVAELLSQPSNESIFNVFDLPQDFSDFRHHDRGTCILSSDNDGGKILKGYILQTPFYESGFWSLVLYSITDSDMPNLPIKISGVFQADINEADFSEIFRKVDKLAGRYGRHPMLLPLQLFIMHCKTTSVLCKSIVKDITDVDSKLLEELGKKSKYDDGSKLYRNLSMKLHKSSMQLVELNRRRKFEKELGERFEQELQNKDKLKLLASIANKSESQDSDIEGLPSKIESQRNVLYSLIAQHDSYLQALLARESLHDANAMKTLAVVTILFLPGAFMASLFSTNMFVFESRVQEIWIYFVVVVPFTVIVLVGWVFWIKNSPEKSLAEA